MGLSLKMKKKFLIIIALTLFSTLSALDTSNNHLLYLMQRGDIDIAFSLYLEKAHSQNRHDFETLQEMSLMLLEKGSASSDMETELLSVYGGGISLNEKAIPILKQALSSNSLQVQLVALNFLARLNHDEGDLELIKALYSPSLLVRVESLLLLAEKKHPKAFYYLESLMNLLPQEMKPIFPKIFGKLGTKASIKTLQKFLKDRDEHVRLEAILAIADFEREELLPKIRIMVSHPSPREQEAMCYLLGEMKDEESLDKLKALKNSNSRAISRAASFALFQLGEREAKVLLERYGEEGDLFSINLLSSIKESQPLLLRLIQHPDPQIQFNAALQLLEQKHPSCLKVITPFLLRDDLILTKIFSPGRCHIAWQIQEAALIPESSLKLVHEISQMTKEDILAKTLDLPEEEFLSLAETLLREQVNELIPLLIELLENLRTKKVIDLLRKYQQKVGAPLVRNYCNLGLFRLKVPGPFKENLIQWILSQHHEGMIRFRAFVPFELRETSSPFEMSCEENSRLFIESIEALAQTQDERAIELIIHSILNGHKKNKFALAGLLIRATN